MSVRRAGPEDVEELRRIRLEALADSPGAYGSTYEDALARSLDDWRSQLTRGAHFFGLDGTRVRGLAVGGTHDRHPGTRWLYGMYVGPDARGVGLADQLVGAVEEWARESGARELYLAVALSQVRAVAFYRRLGYLGVGAVRGMERDPGLLIQTMARRLD